MAQVEHALKEKPLIVYACPPGFLCEISSGVASGYVNLKVYVVSAEVHGVGASKRAAGTLRYRKFDATICATDSLRGGAKVSARFVWYTRHRGHRAVDWKFRKLGIKPLEHMGC